MGLRLFGHCACELVLLGANHRCAKRDENADQRYRQADVFAGDVAGLLRSL
jgi:hypothetical protein